MDPLASHQQPDLEQIPLEPVALFKSGHLFNAPVVLPTPPPSGPTLAGLQQIQQNFAAGAPPSLIVAPTNIPLYPGYQVPGGPGFGYIGGPTNSNSKYAQLLAVIEEMGRDLRPTYSGSKTASERFKRGIAQARILLREALLETERNNQRN